MAGLHRKFNLFFLYSTLCVLGFQLANLTKESQGDLQFNKWFYFIMIPIKGIAALNGLYHIMDTNSTSLSSFLFGVNMFLGISVYALGTQNVLTGRQGEIAKWIALMGDAVYYLYHMVYNFQHDILISILCIAAIGTHVGFLS